MVFALSLLMFLGVVVDLGGLLDWDRGGNGLAGLLVLLCRKALLLTRVLPPG